ncbi:MAG: hypothetical protein ACREU2_09250 [Steroidobacteraceae bacterium]
MQRSSLFSGGICALAIAALSGLGVGAHGSAARPAARTVTGCLRSHRGYLRARLRGGSDLQINWVDAQMQCDGDVRPDRLGIRLTFAGRTGGGRAGRAGRAGAHRIRFIFGIDAPPAAGVTHNVPAGVTVIFEGEHRLYSTRGGGKCTVADLQQESVGAAGTLRVRARGFCIGEATAIGGNGDALLLSTFDFQGRVAGVGRSPSRQIPKRHVGK